MFFDDVDRTKFCLLVQEGIERFGHRVHAFCLMDTHVHLAVQVGEEELWRIMQNLTFRYTRWYNRRHGRWGHLFQGRYKANVVDADGLLPALVRSIHLEPVRAGVVPKPEDARWTSHLPYLGRSEVAWLEKASVLGRFGDEEGAAIREFGRFVAEAGTEDHEEFSQERSDGRVIGTEAFRGRIQEATRGAQVPGVTLDEIIDAVRGVYEMERDDLRGRGRRASEARAMVALMVRGARGLTLAEAAREFSRDTSSLVIGAKRLQAKLETDLALRDRWAQVRARLPTRRREDT